MAHIGSVWHQYKGAYWECMADQYTGAYSEGMAHIVRVWRIQEGYGAYREGMAHTGSVPPLKTKIYVESYTLSVPGSNFLVDFFNLGRIF